MFVYNIGPIAGCVLTYTVLIEQATKMAIYKRTDKILLELYVAEQNVFYKTMAFQSSAAFTCIHVFCNHAQEVFNMLLAHVA